MIQYFPCYIILPQTYLGCWEEPWISSHTGEHDVTCSNMLEYQGNPRRLSTHNVLPSPEQMCPLVIAHWVLRFASKYNIYRVPTYPMISPVYLRSLWIPKSLWGFQKNGMIPLNFEAWACTSEMPGAVEGNLEAGCLGVLLWTRSPGWITWVVNITSMIQHVWSIGPSFLN